MQVHKMAFALVLLAACNTSTTAADGAVNMSDMMVTLVDGSSAPVIDLGTNDAPNVALCPRMAGPADGARNVVVSFPFDKNGMPSPAFGVLHLSSSGSLTTTTTRFDLGATSQGPIAFTPDGKVGVVAEDDGRLGIFRFDENGAPVVVAAAWKGGFYAQRLVMDPSGERVWVLDSEWRASGGGIYSVRLGCDGTPLDEGLRAPAKLPYALVLLDGNRAALAASDVLGSTAGKYSYLLSWPTPPAPPTLLAEGDAFGDDMSIVSDAVVTSDGKHLLIADDNQFGTVPNRIAVVGVGAATLAPESVLTPLSDPVALIASPFDDTVLVVEGMANAILIVDGPGAGKSGFSVRGPMTYKGAKPQLPGAAVMIARGSLNGLVLVGENEGVRMVQLAASASVTDLGLVTTGKDLDTIVGAVGVTP